MTEQTEQPEQQKKVVLYQKLDQIPAAKEEAEKALVVIDKASAVVTEITDESQVPKISEFRARVDAITKHLEKLRKENTAPWRQKIAALNDDFNHYIHQLDPIVAKADDVLRKWARKLEDDARKEREERERLIAEQNLESPDQLPVTHEPEPPAKTMRGSHGSSTTRVDNWKWRLKDISKVPEEYLKDPEDRLAKTVINAKVRSSSKKEDGLEVIPGIEMYNEPFFKSQVG